MSVRAPQFRIFASSTAGVRWAGARLITIWLVASLIAVFFALILRDSTIVDGAYLPRGNDSFYHARRILDAAVGTRGFYQFDDRIQVPDGSWLSWPWAYDWLLAKVVQVGVWLQPSLEPMALLSYVPVAWILVNAALFMGAAGAAGLSLEMRLLAMLCFAVSPLTQLLHAIGMIDHHYVEHTFVLLTAWLGLLWLKQPADSRPAIGLGIALGAAPAFHNGLFILQLLPLTAVFVLWLRGAAPPPAALRKFAAALLITTQLILLPSEPYRSAMFEFGLLSWFHFYVAACTATAIVYMAWRPFSRRNLAVLLAVCTALAVPLGAQTLSAASFLSGRFSILDQIGEVQRPFSADFGAAETASYYSWLLVLAPLLFAFYAFRIWQERTPDRLYYAVVVVFGLALLLSQFRLHVFGFFAFVTGGLLVLDEVRARLRWHRGATFAAALAVTALAYQPVLRERLFLVYPPGADEQYANALTLFTELHASCAADPGVVLASSDDGNPIVFHTGCSVIANNFILRREDKQHIDEVDRLMRLSPGEIRAQRPDVKYVLVRTRDFSLGDDGDGRLVEGNAIVQQLFIDAAPPPGYTLIKTVRRRDGDEGAAGIYARLFKVEGAAAAGG